MPISFIILFLDIKCYPCLLRSAVLNTHTLLMPVITPTIKHMVLTPLTWPQVPHTRHYLPHPPARPPARLHKGNGAPSLALSAYRPPYYASPTSALSFICSFLLVTVPLPCLSPDSHNRTRKAITYHRSATCFASTPLNHKQEQEREKQNKINTSGFSSPFPFHSLTSRASLPLPPNPWTSSFCIFNVTLTIPHSSQPPYLAILFHYPPLPHSSFRLHYILFNLSPIFPCLS